MVTFAAWYPAETCTDGPEPGAKALMAYVLAEFDKARNLGIYNCRTVRGGATTSAHGEGRAIDVGFPLGGDGKGSVYGHALVDAYTVVLIKPAGDIGTSAETTNLDLAVETGDVVSVDVTLTDGASAAAGAIRLFIYDHPDADTLTEAPTAFAAAAGDGTLELAVPFTGKIGTMGLVYDASNLEVGEVVFADLTVGETLVSFDPAPVLPEPTATGRTCDAPGFITIPENEAGVTYEIDGDPYEAGTFAFAPGTYEVTAAGTAWAVTVAAELEACPGKDGEDGKDGSPVAVPTLVPAGLPVADTGSEANPLAVAAVALIAAGFGLVLLFLTAPPKGRYAAPRR